MENARSWPRPGLDLGFRSSLVVYRQLEADEKGENKNKNKITIPVPALKPSIVMFRRASLTGSLQFTSRQAEAQL
jgi:hypothetical protein